MATMVKRDYYEVLGIAKNASSDDIKKAFRNHARKLHPDNKDSGDEAAFKELAEAYEVLCDQEKRAQYDRYGHAGVQSRGFDNVDFSSFAGFGMDDIIDMFFGGGMRSTFRRGGPEQGAHLKFDLEIEFLEAVFGVERKISIRRLEDCENCSGSGATPGSAVAQCQTCAGAGQVQQVVNSWFGQSVRVMECHDCQGSGKKIEKPCKQCHGQGQLRRIREFDLKIPAGIESGARLRLSNGGDKGRQGGPFGDLYVVCHVREHNNFVREGDTIHIRHHIGFSMAALGGETMVPSVDGSKLLKIPAGVQSGTTLLMRDLGVPHLNNPARRGHQVVHVVVETPAKLGREERTLLEQLAQIRGERLTVSQEDREAAELADKGAKHAESQQHQDKKHDKAENGDKHDTSILDKIVGAFKPKNGEQDEK